MEDKLYKIKEVAELFDVSEACIFLWMRQKKLKTIKVPGGTRIKQSEINRILKIRKKKEKKTDEGN